MPRACSQRGRQVRQAREAFREEEASEHGESPGDGRDHQKAHQGRRQPPAQDDRLEASAPDLVIVLLDVGQEADQEIL